MNMSRREVLGLGPLLGANLIVPGWLGRVVKLFEPKPKPTVTRDERRPVRVMVPIFDLSENPAISLDEIRTRRFQVEWRAKVLGEVLAA